MTEEHPVAERERLLREGEAAWTRLVALLDRQQESSSVHAEGGMPWTSADVYAHFARYQSQNVQQLHRVLAGLEPVPPDGLDDDTRNERWAAADRALTFEQAREWCHATTRTLRELLLSLPPELWTLYGDYHGQDVFAPHYEAHIRYIESSGSEGG